MDTTLTQLFNQIAGDAARIAELTAAVRDLARERDAAVAERDALRAQVQTAPPPPPVLDAPAVQQMGEATVHVSPDMLGSRRRSRPQKGAEHGD